MAAIRRFYGCTNTKNEVQERTGGFPPFVAIGFPPFDASVAITASTLNVPTASANDYLLIYRLLTDATHANPYNKLRRTPIDRTGNPNCYRTWKETTELKVGTQTSSKVRAYTWAAQFPNRTSGPYADYLPMTEDADAAIPEPSLVGEPPFSMVGGHKTYHFPVPAAPADPLSPAGATLGPYGVKAYANLADLNFPAVPTGLTWALYHDNASSGAVPFIYAPELTYIYTALASKLEWKWTLLSFSQVMVTWTWVPGDAGGYWAVSNITPVVPAPDWGQLTITQMVELTDAVNLLDAAESIGRANFELIPLGTKRLLGPDILPYTLRTSYHDANELWQAFTPPNQYEWMIGYPYRFQGAFGAVLSLLMNHVRTENRNGVVTKQSFTVPECQKRIQVISPEPGLTVSITKG